MFFTDNTNAPRVIDVNKSYSVPVNNIDQFNNEEILVIKRPPTSAPTISPFSIAVSDAWLEDKIICFGYRFKYSNDEYSATSQFSEPSFVPGVFQFSSNSYLNEGMINSTNACSITFDTGNSLVTEIDLLFKEADSTVIKVVETYNKKQLGLNNSTNHTVQFTNRKIFTILPSSEILRLYDNVPLIAKAQTVMGNRLVYGNYEDGNNLIDVYGNPVYFNYTVTGLNEQIAVTSLPVTTSEGEYTLGQGLLIPNIDISDSIMNVNLGGQVNNLKKIPELIWTLVLPIQLFKFQPLTLRHPHLLLLFFITWSYTLQRDYSSVLELATDADFIDKSRNKFIEWNSWYDTNGFVKTTERSIRFTLTDVVNAAIPQILDTTYSLDQTGVKTTNTAIPNVVPP